MQTVGIIGGIGPESTIEYYRLIISAYQERKNDGHYPQMLINSIDMKKMLDLIGSGRFDEVTDYLLAEIQKIATAGADFAVMASNTPHVVFDQISDRSPLPLISIVEATCQEVFRRNMKQVGLFGTKFTMQGGFYQQIFSDQNVTVITPSQKDQDYIHDIYMKELVKGIFLEPTKIELLKIVDKLYTENGIQGLILGGTELPLILKQPDSDSVYFLDTTRIHVESILKEIFK